jgi:hypothetical protein
MNVASCKTARLLCAVGAAVGLTLSGMSNGLAQDKQKYYFKTPPGVSTYTQQHVIDIGDVPGHQIRVYEIHYKYNTDAPVYDGVKVVEAWTRASSDYTDGNGRASGYAVSLLANGDHIFSVVDIISQTKVGPDGSRKTIFTNVARLAGGTGKFKGIRGTLTGSGTTDFKTGTSDTVTEGEYWMEK